MDTFTDNQLSTEEISQINNVKFSIVTPCLNNAGTIADTIESVIGQSYLNWEHIIIDGGSTDGTVEIIRKNETRYGGRLKFVSEPDNGPNEAIKKGLNMVNGELVNILCSDDWYELESLDIVNKIHSKSPKHDVYYGILRYINQDGDELYLHRVNHNLLKDEGLCFPACFIAANSYLKNKWSGQHNSVADDYAFLLKLYFNGGSFIPVDRILTNFKANGRSSKLFFKGNVEKIFLRRKYSIISKRRLCYLLCKEVLNATLGMIRSL